MNPNMAAEKAALREQMRHRLREITAEDREAFSEEICERVLEMTQWAEAQSAILFTPLPSEPIITPLKLDCEARKISCTILPQSPKSEINLSGPVDLILVPGLAFSKDRHRLGRGGGYFDRLMAGPAASAFKLGICFSFQLLDSVPLETHDVIMDTVVTDDRG